MSAQINGFSEHFFSNVYSTWDTYITLLLGNWEIRELKTSLMVNVVLESWHLGAGLVFSKSGLFWLGSIWKLYLANMMSLRENLLFMAKFLKKKFLFSDIILILLNEIYKCVLREKSNELFFY